MLDKLMDDVWLAMPQMLIAAITPYVASALFAITASTAFVVAATGIVAGALVYGALALGAYLLQGAINPQGQGQQRPEAPRPEDGKYNLKQNVPPLVYVLGENKKAGDYAFLEETGGTAYHIVVWAAHHIKGFKSHWLHDEQITLDGNGYVVGPAHFESMVRLYFRLGDAASTAYAHIVAAFPAIWTNNHRGDGLASIAMTVQSTTAEALQRVFPNGMPQHQAIGEGHDQIYDPRTDSYGYTTNIALFRLWHLTHPVGGKMSMEDMYLPDWAAAADVCDETVFNRLGLPEKRYHGGLWFRANSDPVQVGRIMDQAAELVIYERPDGKIGVHPGKFVEPDVRLTANDLISVSYDPNKRRSSNVLAVRGRFTDKDKGFNTADAAIYGLPYPSDDERTKTVENSAVQSHNHISRLQKLAYIRANAPRGRFVAHYEPARKVPYRRFIKVHYPPKMDEAIIEITGRPTLSLRNLTYEFEGIVLPGDIYPFLAAIEEGAPGVSVTPVVRQDVPVPTGFDVDIEVEAVGGGSSAAYGLATFNIGNSTFTHELQWQAVAGGPEESVMAVAGQGQARTSYLADGTQYRFRMRAWSAGTPSNWTPYQMRTASADPTAPAVPTDLASSIIDGVVTFNWQTPNSANFYASRVWRGASSFGTATDITGEIYSSPSTAQSIADTPGIGAWNYWVTAENASGVRSAPAGPHVVVIEPPEDPPEEP